MNSSTPTETKSTSTRVPALTGIRGLAAISAVSYHAISMLVPSGTSKIALWLPLSMARFAVDTLFVLSGFLVYGSWQKRKEIEGYGKFFLRRIWRILPAFLFACAVFIPIMAPEMLTNWKQLLMVGSFNGYLESGLLSSFNVPLWSMTAEFHFYLLLPIVAYALGKSKTATVFAVVAIAVFWRTAPHFGLPTSLIIGRLDEFVFGAIAWEVIRSIRNGHANVRVTQIVQSSWLSWIVAALFIAISIYRGPVAGHVGATLLDPWVHAIGAFCIATMIVRWSFHEAPNAITSRPLLWFGGFSYSLYLMHFPVLELGLHRLGVAGDGVSPISLIAVTAMISTAVVIGLVTHKLVERPAMRFDLTERIASLRRRTTVEVA